MSGHTVTVTREGYDEVEAVPQCDANGVREAAGAAVEEGLLWLTNGPTSYGASPSRTTC